MRGTGADRLAAEAAQARAAEAAGDTWAALAAWKRYELIRDASREPGELLAESIAVSALANRLASSRRQ